MTQPLDRIIQKEDFARIIRALTPTQLTYVRLRLVGLQDHQIATLCACSAPSAISQTLANARQQIVRTCPDLAPYLTGRKRHDSPRLPDNRVLDWDWIHEPEGLADDSPVTSGKEG